MKWVTSDTHFGHEKIIGFCNRPFKSVAEMNEAMVDTWNAIVKPGHDVYHLGDFSFEKDPAPIFSRLNGQKHLIVGNHDANRKAVMGLPWASVHYIKTLRWAGGRAVMCHFPMESWEGMHRGRLMLHGHCHGSLNRRMPKRFDVGWDVYCRPVAFEEFLEAAASEPFTSIDHHGEDL